MRLGTDLLAEPPPRKRGSDLTSPEPGLSVPPPRRALALGLADPFPRSLPTARRHLRGAHVGPAWRAGSRPPDPQARRPANGLDRIPGSRSGAERSTRSTRADTRFPWPTPR